MARSPDHAPMKAGNPPSPAPAVPCLRPLHKQSPPTTRPSALRLATCVLRLPCQPNPDRSTPGACERCRLDPLVVGLTRSWSAHAAGFVRRGLISPCSTWNICAATGPWPGWFPVAALALAPSGSKAPSLGVDTCGKAGPRTAVMPWRLHPRDRQVGRAPAGDPGSSATTEPPMHGLVMPCRPHVTGTGCPASQVGSRAADQSNRRRCLPPHAADVPATVAAGVRYSSAPT
jgi:hypothetical protein